MKKLVLVVVEVVISFSLRFVEDKECCLNALGGVCAYNSKLTFL